MSEYLGLYKAIVVDNNDPLGLGRIIALVPAVLGNAKTTWAPPQLPTISAPSQGDIVYMQFLNGDPAEPVYHGAYAVSAQNIIANSITLENLGPGSVDANALAAGAVTTAALAAGAVTTTAISPGAITTPLLAANAVEAGNLAAHSVDTEKLTVTAVPLIPNAGFDENSTLTTGMPSSWTTFAYYGDGTSANNPTMSFDTTTTHNGGGQSLKISMTQSLLSGVTGDFENSMGGWTASNCTTAFVTGTAFVNTGTYSLKMTSSAAGSMQVSKTITGFTAGKVYTFIAYAEADASANPVQVDISVQWKTSGGTNIGSANVSNFQGENNTDGTTNAFEPTIYQLVAPATATEALVEVIFGDSTMTAGSIHYLDSIQVIQQQAGVLVSDAVPVSPGQWVQSTFWVQANQATNDGLQCAIWFGATSSITPTPDSDLTGSVVYPNVYHPFTDSFDASGNVLSGVQGFTTSWTKMTARTQVPAGMQYMRMTIGTNPGTYTGSYTVWIDDGTITNDATGNIQSADYQAAVQGWALNDDGSPSQVDNLTVLDTLNVGSPNNPGYASANNLSIAASSYYEDDNGNLQSNTGNATNPLGLQVPSAEIDWLDTQAITTQSFSVPDVSDATFGGQTIPEIANSLNFPQLIYAGSIGGTTYDTGNVGSTWTTLVTTTLGVIPNGDWVNIHANGTFEGTTNNDFVRFALYYTNDGTSPSPTNNVGGIMSGSKSNWSVDAGHYQEFYVDYQGTISNPNGNPIKIALAGQDGQASGSGTFYLPLSDPLATLSIVAFDYGPPAAFQGTIAQKSQSNGGSTSGDGGSGSGKVTYTTHTKTWWTNWSQSYDGDNGKRAGGDGNMMYQGYYDGTHGNQKSIASFGNLSGTLNASNVTSINWIKLTFHCSHTYYNAGSTLEIGTSQYSGGSAPSTWPGKTARQTKNVVAGNTYTVTLVSSCYSGFQNGNIQCITFGPGTNNSLQYYAICSGNGTGSGPTLTVNYTTKS